MMDLVQDCQAPDDCANVKELFERLWCDMKGYNYDEFEMDEGYKWYYLELKKNDADVLMTFAQKSLKLAKREGFAPGPEAFVEERLLASGLSIKATCELRDAVQTWAKDDSAIAEFMDLQWLADWV